MNKTISILEVYNALNDAQIDYSCLPSAETVSAWTQSQREQIQLWSEGKRNKPDFFRLSGSTLPTNHELNTRSPRHANQ